ncbi:MAG: phage tail tape measure protein [Oceanobacillus sp.]|nr:phage tail tape measure protein [Oceanobacillus sp.]
MGQEFSIVGNLLLKVDNAEAGLNKLKSSLSKLEIPKGLDSSLKKSFSNLDGLFAKYKAQLQDGFNTKADVSSFAKTGKQIEAEYDRISAAVTKLTGKEISFKMDLSSIQTAERQLENLITKKEELTKNIKGGLGLNKMLEAMQASDVGRRGTKVFDASNMLQVSLGRGDLEKARTDVEGLISELNRMSEARKQALEIRTGTSFSNIIDTLRSSIVGADSSLEDLNQDIKVTSDSMANIKADQMERASRAIEEAVGDTDRLTSGFKELNGGAQQAAESMYSMTHQLDQLKNTTQYFFSLSNMINLFKRGVREAVQTVKDLDAAMTQTAVVTDFSVGDMWEKLPEYTAHANALGATIQDMYESTTLYYQQGLNTQQAMGVATETMKMARIAGMEAAEATDMMTAALRGFNMEINETSAQRINDVYSQLAAKTASDTEELGTAMQRTASIAHSAGMSFEGTTAFLAQAIETTREPAENIGTAMKTIIARFQEMKKNPLEISEVEGEEVDFNKVDAALKTIGVDLKDTNGQFRELDKVFLDISERWDGLSQTQQRYIATTAAGSRQQSRFIAMMSDYNRTVELMDYANNSAGASTDQFNKTLESLEAKLNKFQNAWKEFLMNIMNDSWTKKIVDGATSVLDTVNDLIDTLSGGSKGVKSFLSVFTAFTGLKAAGKLANMAIGGLGGILDPKSSMFKGMFGGATGMRQGANAAQAKAISDPIVAVLRQIYAKMNNNETSSQGLQRGTWQDFKNAQSKFRATAAKGTIGDTIGTLNGLDKAQINGILANNPAVERRLERGFNQYLSNMDLSEGTQKATSQAIPNIFKTFKQDPNMSPEAFVKALRPDQIGAALAKAGQQEAGKELIQKFDKQRNQAFWDSKNSKNMDMESHRVLLKTDDGYLQAYKKFVQEYQGAAGQILPQASRYEVLASKVGAAGAVFGTAGQAVTSFGLALSKLGLEKVGNGIANLGASISSVGATISSFAMTIMAVGEADGLGAIFAPIVPYLPLIGVALATVAAIGISINKANKEAQNIRNTAQEISDAFKETSDKTKENISNLKQYQSEWGRLLEGVDKNGNNVNLSTDDYDEYLRIVDEIAKINPSIVEGYNAQGRAIITNNKALEETLQKEREIQEEATKTYLEPESLQAILAARNINKDYRGATTTITNERVGRWREDQGFGGTKRVQTAPMANEVQKVVSELKNQKWFTDEFSNNLKQQLGIDIDNLTDDTIRRIVNKEDEFTTAISNMASSVGGEFSDKLVSSLEDLSTHSAAFEEAIRPTFEWLSTYVNQMPIFDNINTKLRPALQEGLKNIAGSDLGFDEMQGEARKLTQEFDSLTNSSSQYSQAIKQAEDLQDKFASDLNADAYTEAINAADGPINKLKQQLEDIKGRSDAAALAEKEFIENEIANIEKFTTSSFGNLSSALNTLQDDIAEAEGAFEAFSKSVESDYSTAVKGMQNIYDKIFEEVDINGSKQQLHTQGYGDKTFWTGAEAMLGQNVVAKSTAKAKANGENPVAVLTKQMERLKPALQQGQEGYYGFLNLINTKYQNAGEKTQAQMEKLIGTFKDGRLDEFHIDEENFSKVAELLKMSDDSLTSMLHNAMQFADLDFMDSDAVRKNLATSNEAIAGNGKTNGNQNLFVGEDYLRQQILDAGYRPEKVEGILDKLDKQGIKTIPTADSLGKDTAAFFKDNLGVVNQQQLIDKLLPTGLFNESQIADYARNMMGENVFDPEQFHAAYADSLQNYEDPTGTAQVEQLTAIHAVVAGILAQLDPNHNESVEKATDDFKQQIVGQTGTTDTASERFAKGQDAEGNQLTAQSFAQARQNLLDIDAGLTAAISKLELEKQTANAEQQSFLQGQIDNLKQLQETNQLNLSTGERAYEQIAKNAKAQERVAKEQDARNAAAKKSQQTSVEKAQEGRETAEKKLISTHLTAEDDASPVIEDAQSKADTFDNTKAEADVTADTADANKDLEKTEDKLNTLDGKKAETKVTTTTEEPKAPTVPTNTTATVSITGDNQQAIASAQQAVSTINGLQSKIIVGANTDAALAKARGLARTISGLSAKVKVTAYYSGGTITIPTKANPIHPHHTGGFVVPGGPIYRAKGGSIFKPKGTDIIPAMLTPGEYVQKRDAVEYFGVDFMRQINHKNLPGALASLDKKINYRSSGGIISYLGNGGDVHGKVNYNWGNGGVTVTVNTGSSNKGNNNTNKSNKGNKSTNKTAETIEKASKDINSWWEKISRQVKEAEKKTKRIGEQVTKVFNDLRASINTVNEVNKDFIDKQKQIIALNQEVVTKSNQKLDILEGGTETDAYASAKANKAEKDKAEKKAKKAYKKKKSKKNKQAWDKAKAEQEEAAQELQAVTPDEVIEANKAYQAAKAAYKKKKTKANKKAVKTAKAAYDKAIEEATKKGENWETIEWQQTKVTKGKNGKKKEKKTDKSEKINLSDYIEKDENGAYFVNQAKIEEVYKKDAEKAEAIQKAAYEKIDEWVNRRDEAEENITGAEDELAKYRKDIDDTFFGWKNELTEVLRITNEIERTEAEINQLQAERERTQLHLDNLDLGFGGTGTGGDLNKYFDEFKQQILKNIELNSKEASQKAALIEANQEEMRAMAALTDATVKYEDINGEVQEETEKAMYQRISTITANGTGTGWDELSTQEKKIFARQQLFQRNLVSGSAEQGYSLQQGGLKQYLQDIKNGQIQEELGSLLKEVFDELNDKTFENLKLETEIYQAKTENEKLEQEITDKANDLNEQLYGWKNSLTKVLELTQKIEQAEKRTAYLKATDEYYNRRSLSGESVSSADILATYMGQMISVVSEIQDTNEKIEAQRADLQSYLNGDEIFREYRSLTNSAPNDVAIAKLEKLEKELRIRQLALEYGNIHQNEDGTVSVSYNSAKLEQDIGSRFDASTGSEIEKFYKDIIDKSNDIRDSMQSSLTKMSDLQQNLIDLRQAYADNAEKVLSAYVNQQQKIIDNLKTVYSSIDNSFKELINSVKQNLQQRRQAEDNAKTQQDISRKQQRLSMLRADTAGGNQVTIAQLQKEIADAQQNYGRTLEDQLLEQMSIQGDTAAKQRERQIELLQAQHNIAKDTGIYAKQVDDWLRNGQYKDTIYTLLKNDIGVDAMTAEKRAISLASIDTDIQDLATFPSKIDATKTAIDSLSTIIGGNEETGQLSLADEISSTVGDAVINASTSTIESFNELALKLFGDGKQNVGAFNALQSSIAASLTSSLSTVLGQKLFGDQKGNVGAFSTLNTAISTVNNTLTGAISTKIGSITTAIGQIKLGASPEDVKEALAKVEAARKTEKESTELTAAKNQATLAAASAKTAQDNAQAAATALANTQTNLTAVNTINTNVNTIKTTLSNIKTSLDNLSLVASNTKYLGDMSPDLEDIKQEVVRSTNTTTYNGLINALHTEGTINKTEFVKAVNAGAAEGVNKSAALVAKDLAAGDGSGGTTWVEVLRAAKGAGYTGTTVKQWFPDASSNGAFRKAFENVYGKWSKFASGGIADYTGPAWLDGTPSKPELVLNATDTRNFLMLRDVLNNVMGSIDSSNGTYGGNATYEININVDRLTNDYDVDKVAERVKKIIVKDSGYRNVTQVRNFR